MYLFNSFTHCDLDVIHTVGPQAEEAKILQSCYSNSFQLMLENDLKSIVSNSLS